MRPVCLLLIPALSSLLLTGCDKGPKDPGAKPGAPQASKPAETKQGTPVVTWEGGSITLEELQRHLEQMNPAARSRVQSLDQRREYAEGLARFELFVAEARRRGLESDPEVQEAMRRALVQQLLFKELDEKAPAVTHEDIAAYYEANKQEFVQPARSRYSHLLVPAPKGSPERAAKKQQAQALLEKARKLQPLDFDAFDALLPEASGNPAAKPSEADTQLLSAQQLQESLGAEVANAASKLKKVGDLSGVVESDRGFHLIKLTDAQPEKNQSLDSVTSMLRARLARQRREERVSRFTQELQARAGFRTSEQVLQQLKVDPTAPQAPATGPAPGFVPAPIPTR